MSTPTAKAAPAPQSPRRKWLFRAGALLLPIILVFALEMGLRVGDYGRPTSFLLRETINGKECLVENPQFGFRFFAPGVARSPTPIVMPAKKEPGTIRIFLFGESAALGDPKPAFGMGRYLEILLSEKYPGNKFEVICAAMTAINSHVVLPIARECAKHEGDLWIVYMGNNEMIGPYGGATLKGKLPPLPILRAAIFLKSTRAGQLLENVIGKFSSKKQLGIWQGLQLFSENQVAADDPVRAAVDRNFERNLGSIIDIGTSSGAKIVLSGVAVNLADCAPHASIHNQSAGAMDEWEKSYHAGLAAQNENRPAEAVQSFSKAQKIDPGFAELRFRTATCELQLTNLAEARREFQAASDFDALAFRSTSGRNEIVKRLAQEKKTGFVAMDEVAGGKSDFGIPGQKFFLDHVHFNFEGNYAAAMTLAVEVEKSLSLTAGKGDWLSQAECEAQLGLTDWNRFLAYENMSDRLAEGIFTKQITNAKSRQWLRDRMNECRRRVKEAPSEDVYKNAIQKRPEDFYLKQNYAEYLELRNNFAGAREQWRLLTKLLPHHPVAYYHSARLGMKLGNSTNVVEELKTALRIRPDFLEARLGLGQAYRKAGKNEEAVEVLQEAVRQYPGNAVAHFNLADVLAATGKKTQAMVELSTAIQIRPDYWEARYLLGVENALRGDIPSAERQFREVVRLKPDFALGHLNLGVALARQNQMGAAVASFQQTLRLDPTNSAARAQLETAQKLLQATP